jgi:hypothetical protein
MSNVNIEHTMRKLIAANAILVRRSPCFGWHFLFQRRHRHHALAVTRLIFARSASVMVQTVDPTLASICSGVVAPVTIDTTSGCRASQLIASSRSVRPLASA